MRFSPLLITTLIEQPLRYFFANYAGENLFYSEDPDKSKIEIASISNYHKIPLQIKPRILVSRGSFDVTNTGLSDNLAYSDTVAANKGGKSLTNMVFINGMAQILIEARQEGALELVVDMVSHFIIWTRPHICNTQGFKEFGMPLNVGPLTPMKEDREIFQVAINVPYRMEEQWNVNEEKLKLNNIFVTIAESI